MLKKALWISFLVCSLVGCDLESDPTKDHKFSFKNGVQPEEVEEIEQESAQKCSQFFNISPVTTFVIDRQESGDKATHSDPIIWQYAPNYITNPQVSYSEISIENKDSLPEGIFLEPIDPDKPQTGFRFVITDDFLLNDTVIKQDVDLSLIPFDEKNIAINPDNIRLMIPGNINDIAGSACKVSHNKSVKLIILNSNSGGTNP